MTDQEVFYRALTIEKKAIDEDTRTAQIAISSEAPYQRYYGVEILDHSQGSIRGEFLSSGKAPLLLDHDPEKQIGVIEEVTLGTDRKLRGVVRFGKSGLASEIFQDVVDGIRSNISVGYIVNKKQLESSDEKTGEVYRVIDWTPLEASVVSIPADTSVGVGRAAEKSNPIPKQENKPMENEDKKPEVRQAETVDVNAIVAKREKEISEILALGAKHNKRDVAEQAIKKGINLDEFRGLLLDSMGEKAPETKASDIGMSKKEVESYSFVRALHALANPSDRRAQEAAKYEREVSEDAASKQGRAPQGLFVPSDVLRMQKRDLTVGTGSAGGYTVGTDLQGASFIEILRNRMVTARLGARMLNGLVGNIAIPRQTGAATAYWVAESGAPTESAQTVDQVTIAPKTVGAFTDISRKLLLQSSVDVEAMVREDLAAVLGLAIDAAAFYGTGSSNQPQGLKTLSGLNTKDFAAAAPTYAEIIDLETQVAADNADIGTLAYVMNARGRGSLKGTEKSSGSGQFIWEAGNTVNGYRAEVSNQIEGTAGSTEDYWFGNWADLMIGMWGGLDLMVDPYSNSTSGTVRVVALQDVDVAARHAQSFCRGANTL